MPDELEILTLRAQLLELSSTVRQRMQAALDGAATLAVREFSSPKCQGSVWRRRTYRRYADAGNAALLTIL
jgi:hypothetical protein